MPCCHCRRLPCCRGCCLPGPCPLARLAGPLGAHSRCKRAGWVVIITVTCCCYCDGKDAWPADGQPHGQVRLALPRPQAATAWGLLRASPLLQLLPLGPLARLVRCLPAFVQRLVLCSGCLIGCLSCCWQRLPGLCTQPGALLEWDGLVQRLPVVNDEQDVGSLGLGGRSRVLLALLDLSGEGDRRQSRVG
jgi:hypothetical protein